MFTVKEVREHYQKKNYDLVVMTKCPAPENVDELLVKNFFIKLFKDEKPTVFIRAQL